MGKRKSRAAKRRTGARLAADSGGGSSSAQFRPAAGAFQAVVDSDAEELPWVDDDAVADFMADMHADSSRSCADMDVETGKAIAQEVGARQRLENVVLPDFVAKDPNLEYGLLSSTNGQIIHPLAGTNAVNGRNSSAEVGDTDEDGDDEDESDDSAEDVIDAFDKEMLDIHRDMITRQIRFEREEMARERAHVEGLLERLLLFARSPPNVQARGLLLDPVLEPRCIIVIYNVAAAIGCSVLRVSSCGIKVLSTPSSFQPQLKGKDDELEFIANCLSTVFSLRCPSAAVGANI
jgi:hypothetical protein